MRCLCRGDGGIADSCCYLRYRREHSNIVRVDVDGETVFSKEEAAPAGSTFPRDDGNVLADHANEQETDGFLEGGSIIGLCSALPMIWGLTR